MRSNGEEDDRVMTTVFAALRLKAEEREPYARGAIPEPDLLNEVLEMIHREEEMGAFLKQPLFIADEFIRPFRVGDLVAARFEILREIGEGGMGIVYEALDRKRSQKIAIKAAKRGFRSFLSPEMEGALRVRHPNVCLVNEIHTATTPGGDVDFLTMELLEGQTLAERLLHNGKLPRTEAVEIARQLCAGIAEAHRVGVLHRDLKPSNVILCRFPDGSRRAVITDFGLSCEAGQSEGLSGTPRYMAPELWLGAEPSRASDLYALGVILFEMADGSQPCGPASEKLPGTSRREKDPYCHLTEACLSLKPERRCEEFTRALQPDYWSAGLWTRRKVLTVAAAGVSGLATGGAWWGSDRFGNLLHPLPKKRLVALIAWPPISDSLIKPVVSGVIDGIENELARFEAFDHDLLVLAAKEGDIGEPNNQRVTQICASLGANLALAVTGGLNRGSLLLTMKVLDANTVRVLRHRSVSSSVGEAPVLTSKAAPAAAALLDLRWRAGDEHRLSPGTASATAFKAYQSAEELRKKPNDDGLEDAIEKYKEAIEADPQYALAYGQLAIAYLRLNALKPASGALELAEANAGKAVQLNSKLAEGHLALASVAKWKGERDQAFAEMRTAISLDPTNPRILLWQAQMYAHFNQFEEARAAYLRLKAERPNYWLAYNELGFLYFSRRDYRGAIEMYRAASLAAPKSSMVFNSIGVVHLTIGDLAEATRNFENSIKLKPNSAAYTNLAETHLAQGKYEDAIACAKRAIALSPGADEYWMDLADSYDAAPGMKHQAIEAYRTARNIAERVLRDDSSDANAWIRLALYKAKTGERVAAMELVRKFDQFPGSDVDSKLVKARILELLGRRREALAVVQESLQTGATRFEVESIADLSHLRNDPAYVRIAGRSTTAKWN